ncbi:hypothetical protein NFI96_031561, partial [Prochilodus magdalenae]
RLPSPALYPLRLGETVELHHIVEPCGLFAPREPKDSPVSGGVSVTEVMMVKVINCCVSAGCTLEDHQQRKGITAYTGGSVLLPCYCTDPQSRPETFRWKKYSTNTQRWEEISSESDQYRNRVQLVNDHSPGNLSLLIPHPTEEDGGAYRCTVDGSGFTDIRLTVKGCTLTDKGQTRYVTAHRGGSVLLPCSCTELRAKPETFTWTKESQNSRNLERISSVSGRYRNRVQLVNDHSPGNLSLLISHLTEEDGGEYMCDGVKSGYTDIRLTVEEPPESLPFIPFALVTLIFLHIVVAVVYCTKRTKGRSNCKMEPTIERVHDQTLVSVKVVVMPGDELQKQGRRPTVELMLRHCSPAGYQARTNRVMNSFYPQAIRFLNLSPTPPLPPTPPKPPRNHSGTLLPLPHSGTLLPPPHSGTLQHLITQEHYCPLLTQEHYCPLLTQEHYCPLLTQEHYCPLLTQEHYCPLLTQEHYYPLLTQEHYSTSSLRNTTAPSSLRNTTAPSSLRNTTAPSSLRKMLLVRLTPDKELEDGCTVEDHQQRKEITAYTGESVLLPCYCTDLQSRPRTFTWKRHNTWEEISNKSDQYRNRVQLGNDHSPGNLSLLISHLTEEDGGDYRCKVDGGRYRDVRLTVKGCSLTDRGQTLSIKAHRGGSVLLPCSCTELRAKPETFTWNRDNHNWERISNESGQYQNRVQLVNDSSPGNLSLLISHLTGEDGGYYECNAVRSGSMVISLTVEGNTLICTTSLPPTQSEPFIYAAVGGLLLLMVLTGIICWRYRAQRRRPVESCESKSEGRRDQETQDDSLVLYASVNKDTSKEPQEVHHINDPPPTEYLLCGGPVGVLTIQDPRGASSHTLVQSESSSA